MQITLFRRAVQILSPRGAGHISPARSQRSKEWVQVLDHSWSPADHHAVTPLEPPHAAASPYIHVVNPLGREFLSATDIVHVVGVSAVDEHVSGIKVRQKLADCFVYNCRRHHQPHRSRRFQLSTKSASEVEPIALSFTRSWTAVGDVSKTTHSWPFLRSRRTIFAPILPRPIIPSCICNLLIIFFRHLLHVLAKHVPLCAGFRRFRRTFDNDARSLSRQRDG